MRRPVLVADMGVCLSVHALASPFAPLVGHGGVHLHVAPRRLQRLVRDVRRVEQQERLGRALRGGVGTFGLA